MRPRYPAVSLSVLLLIPSALNAGSPVDQPRICVAAVANASTVPAMIERLTDRLTKDLAKDKFGAISMDSSTTLERKLHPSPANGEEARDKECDYVLLTQIWHPRPLTAQGTGAEISIGGRVPSVDAADPMGGSSGPVYRENMQVNFALFPMGKPDPKLDTYILDRSSANVSDSFLAAMDREANRVSHELKKKK